MVSVEEGTLRWERMMERTLRLGFPVRTGFIRYSGMPGCRNIRRTRSTAVNDCDQRGSGIAAGGEEQVPGKRFVGGHFRSLRTTRNSASDMKEA
jgi:hypothetical protein